MDSIPQAVIDQLWQETDDDNWEAFLTTLSEHDQQVDGIEDWMIDKIQEVTQIVYGFDKQYPDTATKLRELLIYYDNQY